MGNEMGHSRTVGKELSLISSNQQINVVIVVVSSSKHWIGKRTLHLFF